MQTTFYSGKNHSQLEAGLPLGFPNMPIQENYSKIQNFGGYADINTDTPTANSAVFPNVSMYQVAKSLFAKLHLVKNPVTRQEMLDLLFFLKTFFTIFLQVPVETSMATG